MIVHEHDLEALQTLSCFLHRTLPQTDINELNIVSDNASVAEIQKRKVNNLMRKGKKFRIRGRFNRRGINRFT
jgi:hypothetical protein